MIFGIHAVREALLSESVGIESLSLVRGGRNPRLEELRRMAREKNIPVHELPEEALTRLAGSAAHQGVVARASEYRYRSYEEILAAAPAPGLVLILDGIEDPQNLGAILRAADAAGVSGVFLPERRTAPLSPAVARASAGAAAHLPISRQTNLSRLIERLQRDGYWVVGLDAGAPEPWTKPDYTVPTAVVLGSEGHGIRPLVRSHCDYVVHLPMRGRIASLNVSVSAGIILYEILRQRLVRPAACR